jgi:hypothetical protein
MLMKNVNQSTPFAALRACNQVVPVNCKCVGYPFGCARGD